MAFYVVAREGVTPVAGDVLLALTGDAVSEVGRINEVSVGGESGASNVNRMAVRRSTTNGVGPTTQTPAKMSPSSPAAYLSGATTFTTTQPSTAAAPAIWTYSLNTFGGVVRWVAAPGQELWVVGSAAGNSEVSLESSSGIGVISCQLVFEEL